MSGRPKELGGPVLTPGIKVLLGLGALSLILVAWRFWVGLGPATGLNDGYPWGIWIAFDVVTGTALASGGYAIALLVYVFNKGRYHPLVRPAVLAGALGYTIAGMAIAVDVGRPWNMWKIPLWPTEWNVNSALLEVAICIMAYVAVCWLELGVVFLDKWRATRTGRFRRFAEVAYDKLDRYLVYVIALGIVLPVLHQSSLGTMMVLTGDKLHALWQSPALPLLFLLTSLGMGFAMVVMESLLSSRVFDTKMETPMLRRLYGVASWVAVAFLALRGADLIYGGGWVRLLEVDVYGLLFVAEVLLFIVPIVQYFRADRLERAELFRAAFLFLAAGTLYRFNVYLLAFDPGAGWSYFPTVPEIMISLGFVALEIVGYVVLIKRFPIIAGKPARAHA